MANSWEPYFPYHIEHIVAKQHGGSDDPPNLAFACHHCNRIKGPNLSSIDPDSGLITSLFHPRLEHWADHFAREGSRLRGLTATGRTTVYLLQMNAPHRMELRDLNSVDF